MTIAQTILNQIKAGTDTRGFNGGTKLMMIWGTNRLQATENGLRFKVKGAIHRGYVEVTLDANDTYSIAFYTIRNYSAKLQANGEFVPGRQVRKTVKEFEGVYCDQLTSIIDSTVEQRAA